MDYDSKRKVRIIPGFFLLPSFHYNTFLEHIICIIEYISFNQKDINLKEILEQTKYGSNGIGGIITKGTMYIGYPR